MAATSAPAPTFTQLRKAIETNSGLAPVYLLHGSEAYYTDELVKLFEGLVDEADRDFNLYTFYGADTDADTVIDVCRRFPMMAERQVVIVKEAQAMKANQANRLHHYVAQALPSTLLVIAFRGADAKGKDLISAVRKHGVVFESKSLNAREIGPAISDLVSGKGLSIDPKALDMLREYIGSDLAKLHNEIDKLSFILGPGARITPEAVERNVGISKDYNVYELTDAIIARNAAKAFRIIEYFRHNSGGARVTGIATSLFNYFANLLVYHYTRDKTPAGYLDALGLRQQWQLRNYATGAQQYNVRQTIEIISAIRALDTQSKGIGSRSDSFDLLKNLVFRILTAQGTIVIN